MRKMGIGLQLYTLRNELAEDFRGGLRKVAALGYEGVEFAGYGGLTAEELRALLDELGLRAIGSHVRYPLLKERLQEELAYAKAIGAEYVVCPNLPPEEREDWGSVYAFLSEAGEEAKKYGLRLAYHNHAFEFESKVDGMWAYDALFERVAADRLQVEMDVGWVQFAGEDPLAYIRKYAGRLPIVHLKDFRKAADGTIDTRELGHGIVPLPDVLQAASDAGVAWLVVEQDQCVNPPFDSIATSVEWLKANYLPKVD